jgi:hypothetical protein
MDPRRSARFCGQCEKVVHDLSSMTEMQARALLRGSSESLCVRYLHDATGEIWFAGDRVAPHRLNRAKRVAAVASALAAAPLLMQACGGAGAYDDAYGHYGDAAYGAAARGETVADAGAAADGGIEGGIDPTRDR